MKNSSKKSISKLTDQKVDSDKVIGGKKNGNEGLVTFNDKKAATRVGVESRNNENKKPASLKEKFKQDRKF